MYLNEADTCRVYVTAAVRAAEWDDSVWRMVGQQDFTDGQIALVSDGRKRQNGKNA